MAVAVRAPVPTPRRRACEARAVDARGTLSKAGLDVPGYRRTAAQHTMPSWVATAAAAAVLSISIGGGATAQAASGTNFVVDDAGVLSRGERLRVAEQLEGLEADTGLQVRVYTYGGDSGGVRPGSLNETAPDPRQGVRDALRANFGERSQDDRRVVVVEDVSASNVLDFQVSNAVKGAGQAGQEDGLLPPSFWIEMQARFGNMFYVREHGVDGALLDAVSAIDACGRKPGGCGFVPGVDSGLQGITQACCAFAGAVMGTSLRGGRGGKLSPKWLLVFSPLWGTLLAFYGIGPLVVRDAEPSLIAYHAAITLLAAGLFLLTPVFGKTAVEIADDEDGGDNNSLLQ